MSARSTIPWRSGASVLLLLAMGACAGAAPRSSVVQETTSVSPALASTAEASADDPSAAAADAIVEAPSAVTVDEAPASPLLRRVRIGASGDLLAHIRVVTSAREHGGFAHVLGPLEAAIDPGEIAFLNLETPLSEERPVLSGSPPILGAPAEIASVLAAIGIDLVSVANNHAWDQYSVGLGTTLGALRDAGVVPIGAGPDVESAFAPHVTTTADGARVAFVAITERVNGGPGPLGPSTLVARWAEDGPVERALAAARAAADLVVVSIHWSHDFRWEPLGSQRERARWLVEHGADVILGHGPHILQEVERLGSPRGEAICVYSLGNVVSNQGFRYVLGRHGARGANPATWMAEARDGVWLRIEATLEEGHVAITSATGVALFTYNNYFARERDRAVVEDIRIQLLRDVENEALRAERFRVIAETLGPHVTLDPIAPPPG